MYIFLIVWFFFLFAYIIFNAYGVFRVLKMRIRGDIIPVAAVVYLLVMFIIILTSIIFISTLDWGAGLRDLIRI